MADRRIEFASGMWFLVPANSQHSEIIISDKQAEDLDPVKYREIMDTMVAEYKLVTTDGDQDGGSLCDEKGVYA